MNKKRQRAEIGGENGFEEWGGYMAAKKTKLQGQFHEQAKKLDQDTSDIFKDVCVFVNGYTVPTADEIKHIMMENGGIYHHYFSTEHTTHIIATNLPDVKIKKLKGLHINIVKPDWITACLSAGHQVDFRPYLLYSHQSRTQPSIRSYVSTVPSSSQETSCTTAGKVEDAICQRQENDPEHDDGESSEDLFSSPELKEAHQDKVSVSSVLAETKQELVRGSNTTKSATDPNFLAEFYENSRLHHISTMGATFKQLIYDLRQKKNHNFSGIVRLRNWKKENTQDDPSPQIKICEEDEDFGSSLDDTPKPIHDNQKHSVVMHIDMDCFFVSVGLCKHPHLKGKPVAVTHSKGHGPVKRGGTDRKYEFNYYKERLEAKLKNKNGSENDVHLKARLSWADGINETDSMAEIASCSYEARRTGVKNGMFVGAALKLCPDLKFIPYDFDAYQDVATILYETVASYTLNIEAVSCDEMFVDCSDILRKTQCSIFEFGSFIRKEIKAKTSCPASTGFGSNRLLARLATRKAKPDGIFHLEEPMVMNFMKTVNVNDLPGVGRTLTSQLHGMGIFTCGDLQKLSQAALSDMFKGSGALLFSLSRGLDNRPLVYDHQRKSVSAEVNYGIRFKTQQEVDMFIRQLALEVQTRLTEAKVRGSCITLKLLVRAKDAPTETAKFMGHGVCDNLTRSSTLPRAVCDADTIAVEVLQIVRKLNVNPSDLRGVGIQITKLESLKSSSTGALDKFFVKNESLKIPDTVNTNQTRICDNGRSSGSKIDLDKMPQKMNKVFTHKGAVGIDHFMVARKKTTRKDNVMKLPPAADLDLEVLKALPADILREVMGAYESNSRSGVHCDTEEAEAVFHTQSGERNPSPPSKSKDMDVNLEISYSQVDPSFLAALPSDVREELKADLYEQKAQKDAGKISCMSENRNDKEQPERNSRLTCYRKKSILEEFVQRPIDLKEMIRQWVAQEADPQPCDVHIIEHYFCDLVHDKCIDELDVMLKFFRRLVAASPNSMWQKKFRDILSTVQESMMLVYHSLLQVEDI